MASICLARKSSNTVYFGTWKKERTSRIGERNGEKIVGQPGRNAHIYEIVKQSGVVFLDTFFFKCQRFRINHNGKLRGWDGIDYSWMLHRSNIQLQPKAEVLSAYLIHCKSFPWHTAATSLMATLTARYHICLCILECLKTPGKHNFSKSSIPEVCPNVQLFIYQLSEHR